MIENEWDKLIWWPMGVYIVLKLCINGNTIYLAEAVKEDEINLYKRLEIINDSYIVIDVEIEKGVQYLKRNNKSEIVLVYHYGEHPLDRQKIVLEFRKFFMCDANKKKLDWIVLHDLKERIDECFVEEEADTLSQTNEITDYDVNGVITNDVWFST